MSPGTTAMPSPFPGMDPFIEGQAWRDFHTGLLVALRKLLVPQVRPRYVVHVEEYVYLATEADGQQALLAPDVHISDAPDTWPASTAKQPGGGVSLQPVVLQTPLPEKYEQTFLEIRTRDGSQVVTVIEVLSPWNKSLGAGRTEYLQKRHNILATSANLVEIDLLLAGQRLPTTAPLPQGDYFAFVSRRGDFPAVNVFAWDLRDQLPRLPVPLASGDADVKVDLQAAFSSAYDDAGYDYSLKYNEPPSARFTSGHAQWIEQVLNEHGKAS